MTSEGGAKTRGRISSALSLDCSSSVEYDSSAVGALGVEKGERSPIPLTAQAAEGEKASGPLDLKGLGGEFIERPEPSSISVKGPSTR